MGEPVPREQMRVSDAEREAVAEQLRLAHGEGRIDLHEFDERCRLVWAARTYGELATVTSDLPSVRGVELPAAARPATPRRTGRDGYRLALRTETTAWLGASLVNILVWGVVAVAVSGPVYPWWIWVAGPWGALLLTRWVLLAGRRS